jgi:hypothetical protein
MRKTSKFVNKRDKPLQKIELREQNFIKTNEISGLVANNAVSERCFLIKFDDDAIELTEKKRPEL